MKIAIIGGGSAYAPGLLQAFAAEAETFDGAELALMDVAAEELGIVHLLGRRLLEGTEIEVTATTDRVAAIDGATYVLTTFREGGLAARHLDEAVPLEYGVIGQETIGPGGFFFAMRTIPVMKAIADEITRWAPDATLLNYTNPTQIVAEALTRHTDIRCIAICDQTEDDRVHIAEALGLSPADIRLEGAGLNHATWSTTCEIEGSDGVERMIHACDHVRARDDVSPRTKRQFELTRRFGRVPNSYLQYYYQREETVAEARRAKQTRAEAIAARLPGYYRHFREQAAADRPNLTEGRGGSVFGDFAVRALRTLASGERARLTLNVPNQDRVFPNFAAERVVEVPCILDRGQISPEPQEPLPADQVALIAMLAEYQAAAADAIWSEDLDALPRALATNPLVVSLTLADDLLAARRSAGAGR